MSKYKGKVMCACYNEMEYVPDDDNYWCSKCHTTIKLVESPDDVNKVKKDEFIEKLIEGIISYEECPSEFGLKDCEARQCRMSNCPSCWEQAKKQLED